MRKKIEDIYKTLVGKYDSLDMPVLREILKTLDEADWRLRSGCLFYSNDVISITANKKYNSKWFITTTQCDLSEDLVFVKTKCKWSIPDDKYIKALKLVNKKCFEHIRVSYAISLDKGRFTYFDCVPFKRDNEEKPMQEDAYLCSIWSGIFSCNKLVKAIKKKVKK